MWLLPIMPLVSYRSYGTPLPSPCRYPPWDRLKIGQLALDWNAFLLWMVFKVSIVLICSTRICFKSSKMTSILSLLLFCTVYFMAFRTEPTVHAKTNRGATPMTVAIEQHNALSVRMLIQHGYSMNERFKWGETPLDMCLRCGSRLLPEQPPQPVKGSVFVLGDRHIIDVYVWVFFSPGVVLDLLNFVP